jgi:DNA modification methylase
MQNLTTRLFWIKPISTKNTSKNYGRFVEIIYFYRGAVPVWNTGLNWANYTGVYHDMVIGETTHPYEKPLSLIERFVRLHSHPGHIVLDPFCGSGTTLLAAKRLGRNYIGYDNIQENIELSKRRLNYA